MKIFTDFIFYQKHTKFSLRTQGYIIKGCAYSTVGGNTSELQSIVFFYIVIFIINVRLSFVFLMKKLGALSAKISGK